VNAPQIASEHYWSREYNTKERFASFWHQIDETLALEPATVLEIGPGAGLVTWCLGRAGIEVTTLDLDQTVDPDIVGSASQLPLNDNAVDVILISEVLEHLPFPEAERALAEVARVARTGVVMSVPDDTPYVAVPSPRYFSLYLQRARREQPATRAELARGVVKRQIRLRDYLWNRLVPWRWGFGGRVYEPRIPIPNKTWKHEFDGQHHWELGTEDYPPERMRDAIKQAGMTVTKDFRVPELPWHHFYVAWAPRRQ
jgi:SAM-dependent methyltransferase